METPLMCSPAAKDPGAELRRLMARAERNELECKKYLVYAQERLVKATPIKFLQQEEEYRGHFGDSDYMVRCVDHDEVGGERNLAYLWEVKAPQCCLFVKDTENRVRPSPELVSAENQLLHYYRELNGNPSMLKAFRIFPGDLHLGGIIIGSINNFVEGKFKSTDEGMRLSSQAYDLRKQYFYERAGFEVITWNRILEHMQKTTPISKAESRESISKELKTNPPDLNIRVIKGINIGESVLAILKRESKSD
jgi:hypothetical protein